ncbi:hypothetical protein [Enterobacter roggenkampii]|uniref:hypothetical protein n=1 Tax=Enterobacter roggenkampii TaxID=1812935 RepID=UPI00399BE42E
MKFKGTKRNWSEAEFSDFISFSHPGMALSGRATEETKANGRLAMAAPDLLEALQELVFLYEHDEGCRELTEYKRAKAAISKALGEE